MGSYQRSLLAIMLAQFTRKRFAGGMAGVVRLASRNVTVQVRLSLLALQTLYSGFKRFSANGGCVRGSPRALWLNLNRSTRKQNQCRHPCLQGFNNIITFYADPRHCTVMVRYKMLCACAGAIDGGSWSGCACAAAAQQVGLCSTSMHVAYTEHVCN